MTRRGAWPAEEEARLRMLVAERTGVSDIGAMLDRTPAAVHMRMHRLGLRLHPKLPRASVHDVAELFEAGIPAKLIARRLDIRPSQVVHAIRSQGLVNAHSRVLARIHPYDAEIQALSAEGITVAEIGRRVGQPANRVRSRLVTLARRELVAEAQAASPSLSSLSSSAGTIRSDDNHQETT